MPIAFLVVSSKGGVSLLPVDQSANTTLDKAVSYTHLGATGLVLPERNWMSAAGTVIKASAGASERIKTAVCGNLKDFLLHAKAAGLAVLCAERKDAVPLYEQRLDGPLLLAVGGEKRGVSKTVFDLADRKVYIPYGRDFRNSLSASAACAVFAFEIYRQRNSKKRTG